MELSSKAIIDGNSEEDCLAVAYVHLMFDLSVFWLKKTEHGGEQKRVWGATG